jgi:hypothetical protein
MKWLSNTVSLLILWVKPLSSKRFSYAHCFADTQGSPFPGMNRWAAQPVVVGDS